MPTYAAKQGPRPKHLTIDELFWSRVQPVLGDNRCWEWPQGNRKSPWPYGHFSFEGRNHPAHRVAWLLTFGAIPEGMFVCHTCDNPPCTRLSHLFLGTPLDNMRDMIRKGRDNYPGADRKKDRWSFHYPACIDCGTTAVEHKAKGRCHDCYSLTRPGKAQRKLIKLQKQQQPRRWAKGYDACVICHTTFSICVSRGRCKRCYERKNNALPGSPSEDYS